MHHIKKKLLFFVLAFVAAIFAAFAGHTLPDTAETPAPLPSGPMEIVFVDVGQGDSTFVKTANGETILIDGGEYDTYESHLLPFLEEQEVDKIDYAVTTHYHSDHMGGIERLTRDGLVERLYLPDYKDTDNSKTNLIEIAEKRKTEVSYLSAGSILETNCPGLSIKVLHPQKGGCKGSNFHNNSSLVLSITYGGDTFLITGDIEARGEKEFLVRGVPECAVLKIPHHGSSTSSSKRFIMEADPTYGIISAGANNRYGHPHSETLSLLADEDIMVYRTDKDGHITFTVTEKGIDKITFSKT
ncbi:MAG: MBL fold metallo-hydrolase [Ruminococcaceae bacterium]|nr:MBL fold metallo-hydrolase [Oscillospiraceae bacterium]